MLRRGSPALQSLMIILQLPRGVLQLLRYFSLKLCFLRLRRNSCYICQFNMIIGLPLPSHSQQMLDMQQEPSTPTTPTSPRSFLKKHSHILTNHTQEQPKVPGKSTRNEIKTKQMHRSHFQSDVFPPPIFRRQQSMEMLSSESFSQDEECAQAHRSYKQAINSQYNQSHSELSSEKEGKGRRGSQRFGLSQCSCSEKSLKRVTSLKNHDKFLVINSKKQTRNSKDYTFLNDIEKLQKTISTYEASIDRLKKQNLKLRSEKVKLSSTNEHMELVELRFEFEKTRKRVQQLENEALKRAEEQSKCMKHSNSSGMVLLSASCLPEEGSSKLQEAPSKTPIFKVEGANKRPLQFKPQGQGKGHPSFLQGRKLQIQSIKSPHFLKKN